MHFRRLLNHRAAGLALLAALALTWLPALSRALAPVDLSLQGTALCRADGDRPAAHALDHCAHCLLAAATGLPPASAAALAGLAAGAGPAPALPAGLPSASVRAAAAARAPPGRA